MDDNETVTKHLSDATKLAARVATDARLQWATYREKLEKAAQEIDGAARKFGEPNPDERALMNASALVASSLANVLIDFADAAVTATLDQTKESRPKAAKLVRKLVKAAVDDTLEVTTQVTPRGTRMLELRKDYAWETIYLPRGVGRKAPITVKLSGLDTDTGIEIRPNRGEGCTLTRAEPAREFELQGSRPSLSIRVDPNTPLEQTRSALLEISGAHSLTLGLLLVAPPPAPEAKAPE